MTGRGIEVVDLDSEECRKLLESYIAGYPDIWNEDIGEVQDKMRIARKVVGALLVIVGCVWLLQGVNIIPGSFMTGQMKWAVYGAITLMVGLLLIFAGRTKKPIL